MKLTENVLKQSKNMKIELLGFLFLSIKIRSNEGKFLVFKALVFIVYL